jgi:hypothetical protein
MVQTDNISVNIGQHLYVGITVINRHRSLLASRENIPCPVSPNNGRFASVPCDHLPQVLQGRSGQLRQIVDRLSGMRRRRIPLQTPMAA